MIISVQTCIILMTSFLMMTSMVTSHRGHVTNWLISKPNEMVACERENMNLMCDHYQGIRITEAFWGRDNDFDCQVSEIRTCLVCLGVSRDLIPLKDSPRE